ncbi:ABC transporter substrate-binding protein [Methanohalobium sp.]|uniref:ABC transporter substrate-binding protein n=1 Tax=Methanohalobium sp. TaxID=2837493 RepID=UPI0025D35F76|nr:ABC transporter substrate-binding protein [Methanohalobium sp.]
MNKTLNIGHLSTMYHSSFVLMSTDWLEKSNIKVNWNLFGGGPAIVEAFEKGEIDLGYIGLPPAMKGIDKGLSIKCIAGGHVEGTVMIAVHGYKSLDEFNGEYRPFLNQFKGLTIACPPKGSIHDVIIREYLRNLEFENEITIKNYEWADMIPESMADGDIHVAIGTPSLAVVAKRFCEAKTVITPDNLWKNNPSYGIVAKQELIDSYPELVFTFVEKHDKACKFIKEKPEHAAQIISDNVGIVTPDFVYEILKMSPKYSAKITKCYIKSTMEFVPILQNLGYIKKNLDEKDIFDIRFLNRLD